MLMRYLVSKGVGGWYVSENGSLLVSGVERRDAVQTARLSAFAAKATGAPAVMFIESETGVVESVDPDNAR